MGTTMEGTYSEAMRTALPVYLTIARGKFATSEELVCCLLPLFGELRVYLAAVDEERSCAFRRVFL